MGEHKDKIVCHLTKREQGVIGLHLSRIAMKQENRGKLRMAFRDLGLGWVRTKLDMARVTPEELEITFNRLISAGAPKAQALLQVCMSGQIINKTEMTDEKVRIEADRGIITWVLEQLEDHAVQGDDVFVLGDIEDRFKDAKRGEYKLPAELQQDEAN